MSEHKMSEEMISCAKTDAVLGLLVTIASGPKEAYGILATCLHRLNFEFADHPANIDQLCAEVAITLRSITEVRKNLQ